MYTSFDPNNLLHWVSLLIALTGILSFFLAWKKFRFQYQKPRVEIIEKHLTPRKVRFVKHDIISSFVKMQVFNRYTFDTYITIKTRALFSFRLITSRAFIMKPIEQTGEHCKISATDNEHIGIYLPKIKRKYYDNKRIWLILKDIRGKRIIKLPKIKDEPKKQN